MKKKMLFTSLALAVASLAFAQRVAMVTYTMPFMEANVVFAWSETTYDFGKVQQGTPVTHEFTFTNNGTSPLVISTVKASCGCTVADYSKDSIQPGEKGFVKATYNASQEGVFTKTVTVNANAEEGAVVLYIKGEVVK